MSRSVIESDFARVGGAGKVPASSIGIGIGCDGSRVIGGSGYWRCGMSSAADGETSGARDGTGR